jgi:hypothetical protein
MRRALSILAGVAAATSLSFGLFGCGGGGKAAAPGSTTVPQALWLGQARDWLGTHGGDLSAISTSAKNLGDAAKAGNAQSTQFAVTRFMTAVGRADGNLPANAFGQDLHGVFVDYVVALGTIQKGLIKNDQRTFKAGSDELAAAVNRFAAITDRLKQSP